MIFKMIDKQEFMAVSEMNRMAYNDQYIIGQSSWWTNLFFINLEYESMRVYNNP